MNQTPRAETPIPRRIGRYEILLPIASGGMGAVYLAKSHGLGGFARLVAVKVMHAHLRDEKEFAQDLVEEAKLAGRIQHPNVVPVLDVGDDPFGVFLVMDYVEGDTLAGLLRARRTEEVLIPPRIGLKILTDALLGLHAAHDLADDDGQPLGLVHRDFSPQNILIGLDGVSRLSDFGVAKASSRLTHTRTGMVKGKVHYMSPEQAKSEPLDRRSDLWAAGVIAWEILAGKRLYKDRGETAVLLRLITELPPRLRRVRPDLPYALEDAVARALSIDLDSRWPTAKEMCEALARGAEPLGGLASCEEVAAYVNEVAFEALGKRRQQLRDVMKLHDELATIERQADEDNRRRKQLATPSDSEDTAVTITEPVTQPSEPVTEVTGTPQAIDVRDLRSSRSWRGYALAIAALSIAAFFVYRQLASEPEITPLSTTIAEPERTAAPSVSASAPAVPPLELTLRADVDVRELWVGDRRVILSPPTKSFQLKLGDGERESVLRAVSVDGRQTRASIAPDANVVELAFPKRALPRPRPPRAAPLASSPYVK